jgi:tRNA(adenine34) deaminase
MTADSLDHAAYMAMALRQACRAAEDDEVPTGAVIIRVADAAGQPIRPTLVAQAHNQVERLKDPTAHAEMIAITQAANAIGDWRLNGTVLYVTKEPCAMCAGAIVLARIDTVVFGVADPRRGGVTGAFNILSHPALIHRCEVIGGVMEAECKTLLQGFFAARRGRED